MVIFGVSMITLYTASGVFHGVPFTMADNPAVFRFCQRIDRSAIFVLIAGTNTPLIVTLLSRAWRQLSSSVSGWDCLGFFPLFTTTGPLGGGR